MALAADWLMRSNYFRRPEQFGALRLAPGPRELPIVTMRFADDSFEAHSLWNAWGIVPPHLALIPALQPCVLRYAAIDWQFTRLQPSAETEVQIASYGLDLCDLFEHLIAHLGDKAARWFVRPYVTVDLEGVLRVAFEPPSEEWRAHPRAFVQAVGRGLRQVVSAAIPHVARTIIGDCLESSDPTFASLAGVASVLRKIDPAPRTVGPRLAWEAIEQGIGARSHVKPILARKWMERAVDLSPSPIARDLLAIMIKERRGPIDMELASSAISMTGIDPLTVSTGPEVPVPRIFQNVHDAQQPTRIRAKPIEAAQPAGTPEQQVDELLHRRRYREALDRVDAWLATAPDEPRAHHLRGKALLALGRLPDARAAFDRACTLRPQLLEAMLLRREVDRVMSETQAAAGVANAMTLALPDHLSELRDVMVSGRIVDAIQLLRRPAYDDDTVAQMLLAELMCTDQRHDDALAIYDRLGTDDAKLGKARALLVLDRAAEALEVLAAIMADEAYELRSRALLALGRGDEAEVQMSAYLRAIEQRSDRRLGSR